MFYLPPATPGTITMIDTIGRTLIWNGEKWNIVSPLDRQLAEGIKRLWLQESPPYPPQVEPGDLWYYSGENRLYLRKEEYWVQIN